MNVEIPSPRGETPAEVSRTANGFLRYIFEQAEQNDINFNVVSARNFSCFWGDDTSAVYFSFPADQGPGYCDFSIAFSPEYNVRDVMISSSPHNNQGYYHDLRQLGILALTYLDQDISYGQAGSFLKDLADSGSSDLRDIGGLKCYLVIDNGDADVVMMEIRVRMEYEPLSLKFKPE